MKYGMIAGNGRFPVLALETARKMGDEVVAIGIKEEASPEIEGLAARCYWVSLGELSRLIEICHQEGVSEIMMCGQVKHAKIFSSIRPDWKLFKVLAALPRKNTDSLIGAVQKVLADDGIALVDSTKLLKPLLAAEGVLTRRKPTDEEKSDIEYGRRIATALASVDVGQSAAICERACVAVEAMEGTDAMLRRAAGLANGRRLTLVKSSARRRHLLFDVPVIGASTIPVMVETGTTALAVDAGRTLLLDREEMLDAADRGKIAIIGMKPLEPATAAPTGRGGGSAR
jgi:UDP-2,3-diacylglucosamine hydrolase